MRIEFIKKATAAGVAYKKGADADLPDAIAEKLIARGYAELWTEKPAEETEAEDGPADS